MVARSDSHRNFMIWQHGLLILKLMGAKSCRNVCSLSFYTLRQESVCECGLGGWGGGDGRY